MLAASAHQSQNASRGARGFGGDSDVHKVTELGVRPQLCVSCCCDDPSTGGLDPLQPARVEPAAVWTSLVDAWVWDGCGDKTGKGHHLVALGGEGAGALGAQVRGDHRALGERCHSCRWTGPREAPRAVPPPGTAA